MQSRFAVRFAVATIVVWSAALPAVAEPRLRSPLSLDAELAFALPTDAANAQRFGLGLGGAIGVEYALTAGLAARAALAVTVLSRDESPSSALWVGARAGVRAHWGEWLEWESTDAWLDAHVNFGDSGGIARWGGDVGAGCAFEVTSGLGVGPHLRMQLGSDPSGGLAQWTQVGLIVTALRTVREGPSRPRDTDSDGVLDANDVCPTDPAGAHPDARRPGCAARDEDGDGVFDADDECPAVPRGARPHPDRPGCPDADRDGDTVPDRLDRCPDRAGAPSQDPERNGCPGLVRVDQQQIRLLQPVYFATNRDVILEASFPVLAAVVDAILATGIRRIRVEGHTDAVGNDDANQQLSQRRAESIRTWLVEHGIASDAVEAVGRGETAPIEPNDTELGRAANRRVEFHILDIGL